MESLIALEINVVSSMSNNTSAVFMIIIIC